DRNVTGVQTCALPISHEAHLRAQKCFPRTGCALDGRRDTWFGDGHLGTCGEAPVTSSVACTVGSWTVPDAVAAASRDAWVGASRSEERRVGKERGSGW